MSNKPYVYPLHLQVHLLRDEADKIEEEILEAGNEIQGQERDIGRLRGHLNNMESCDSLYVSSSVHFLTGQTRASLRETAFQSVGIKLSLM